MAGGGLWRVHQFLDVSQTCFFAQWEDEWSSGVSIHLFEHVKFRKVTQSLDNNCLPLTPNVSLRAGVEPSGSRAERGQDRGSDSIHRNGPSQGRCIVSSTAWLQQNDNASRSFLFKSHQDLKSHALVKELLVQ